jgi:membrane-bound metal-dependent hydrolase YbcI (DUF457 family)
MPSPVGHALGGIAAGWLVENLRGARAGPAITTMAAFAGAGMLPDVDLVFGVHRGPTHSLSAALIAGLAVFALTRRVVFAAAFAAAYASHTLLDWMGHDTTPPIGMTALWPFDRSYHQSRLHLFDAVSRRYWLPGFWAHNFAALARELAVLVPVVAIIGLWRSFRLKREATTARTKATEPSKPAATARERG